MTSSVDWCEQNYAKSYYVAELFNTLSSLAMVAAGAFGFWLHRRTLEKRFLLAYLLVAVVGLGSIAFHATLRFELQMLDELPMLYAATVLVYILLENRTERRFGPWFPWVLVGYALVATYLAVFTRGKLQYSAFRVSFSILECFALLQVFLLYRRSTKPVVRRLFHAGISLYAVAVLCWLADIHLCEPLGASLARWGLPYPQLHSVWHVCVSGGLYLLVLVIAYQRLELLGRTPSLRRLWRCVPYVARARQTFQEPVSDSCAPRTLRAT